jgi:energy-coupling factor transporter ATP-binding protein EcfA2
MSADNHILSLKDVTYSYPGTKKRALKDINLKIKQGEFVGIVGMRKGEISEVKSRFEGLIRTNQMYPKSPSGWDWCSPIPKPS